MNPKRQYPPHYETRNIRRWNNVPLKDIPNTQLNNLIPFFGRKRFTSGILCGWFSILHAVSIREKMFRELHGIYVSPSNRVVVKMKKFKFLK